MGLSLPRMVTHPVFKLWNNAKLLCIKVIFLRTVNVSRPAFLGHRVVPLSRVCPCKSLAIRARFFAPNLHVQVFIVMRLLIRENT